MLKFVKRMYWKPFLSIQPLLTVVLLVTITKVKRYTVLSNRIFHGKCVVSIPLQFTQSSDMDDNDTWWSHMVLVRPLMGQKTMFYNGMNISKMRKRGKKEVYRVIINIIIKLYI